VPQILTRMNWDQNTAPTREHYEFQAHTTTPQGVAAAKRSLERVSPMFSMHGDVGREEAKHAI
jgi:hypothetical protein